MPAFIDLTGRIFGRLTVLGHTGRPRKHIRWNCLCSCGTEIVVEVPNLKNGHVRSCGCLNIEEIKRRRTTHGATTNDATTSTYTIWLGMKGRCSNPNSPLWKHYGGRGITVCGRWMIFENFLADMGERPDGLSIERTDNNAGYSPENCVWADRASQSVNKRTTKFVMMQTGLMPFAVACEKYGVRYQSMWTLQRRSGRPLTEADFEGMQARTQRR